MESHVSAQSINTLRLFKRVFSDALWRQNGRQMRENERETTMIRKRPKERIVKLEKGDCGPNGDDPQSIWWRKEEKRERYNLEKNSCQKMTRTKEERREIGPKHPERASRVREWSLDSKRVSLSLFLAKKIWSSLWSKYRGIYRVLPTRVQKPGSMPWSQFRSGFPDLDQYNAFKCLRLS